MASTLPLGSSGMSSSTRRTFLRPILRNSVLKIKSAHNKAFTNAEISQNSQGFIKTSLQSSLAHAPSIYYYLSQRCGIGYKEAEGLVSSGGLAFGDDCELVTDLQQLRMQLPFESVEDLQLKIQTSASNFKFVPVEQRQLHRQYIATYLRRGIKFASDPAEPKSFIYTLPEEFTNNNNGQNNNNNNNHSNNNNSLSSEATSASESSSYFNLILGPGAIDRNCYGFGIATNDLAMVPFFRKRDAGNFAVYRIWFEPGVPQEEVDGLAHELNERLRGAKAERWQVVDEDVSPSVPQFAFSCDGVLFPQRIHRKYTNLDLSRGTQHLRSAAKMEKEGMLFRGTVAKSIWICTPFLPKTWMRDLLMHGRGSGAGARTTDIEMVQIGHNFRFLHPEVDEYLSLPESMKSSARTEKNASIVEALDVEEKSWKKLDQQLFQSIAEKKKHFGPLHIISPGRRSTNWLGHFDTTAGPNSISKQWFEPLSPEAIGSLHASEKRAKINALVRSLRDSCAE